MKGFGSICRYELKKILSQKTLWVAVIVLLYWSITCGVRTPSGSYAEYLQTNKAEQLSITGEKIDDEMLEKMYALEQQLVLLESEYVHIYQYTASFITRNANGEFELPEKFGGESALYDARSSWVHSTWRGQELTDEEIAYWQNYEDKLDIPFTYSYSDSYYKNINFINNWFVVHSIIVALCLCTVFSDEFRFRTDQFILSSNKGKKMLYKAKIISGMSVALVLTIVALTARTVAMGVNYGFEGFDAQIQLLYPTSSLDISVGEAMLLLYGLVLAATCLTACFVMALSLISANGVVALAVPVGIVIANLFLETPTDRLVKQIYSYFPVIKIRDTIFTDNLLVSFGTVQFNTAEFAFILYFVLAIALYVIAQIYWKRLQVKSR